jgi:hypothetical protein
MECTICYEKFFIPKTKEELEKKIEETINNNDFEKYLKFDSLLITSKHNTTRSCPTPNCECIICRECWIKITHTECVMLDDLPNPNDYFKCPFCRQIDWKDYMEIVFNELQQKVLTKEEFRKVMDKQLKNL